MQDLKERDYIHGVFKAVGYPVDTTKEEHPTPAEALSVALMTLEHPEPRSAEAAIAAMLFGVLRGSDEVQTTSEATLRRAGYASDRLLSEVDLSSRHRAQLQRWVRKLEQLVPQASSKAPLGWSAYITPGRMMRLHDERDSVNMRWQIYGTARVRSDVLRHVLDEASLAAP